MKYFTILVILYTICSCQSASSVSQEMDEYCDCIKDPLKEMQECTDLRNELVREYEFDAEAIEIIQMKLSECVRN